MIVVKISYRVKTPDYAMDYGLRTTYGVQKIHSEKNSKGVFLLDTLKEHIPRYSTFCEHSPITKQFLDPKLRRPRGLGSHELVDEAYG